MPSLSDTAAVRRAALLSLLVAGLIAHALLYRFVTDDAYISFVFSRNLAEHGVLAFNPDLPPVEGYTNFLWTVLLAGLMWLGVPPEPSSQVLGIGFAAGSMLLALKLSAHVWRRPSPWDHLAPALLAASAGYACWSSGGLETQLFTFLVTWALYEYTRGDAEPVRVRRVGIALALAAMTRPEGLLVAGVLGLHRLALNLARDRRLWPHVHELGCILWFLALWGPWFAWRWQHYGWPFPNTYYVKAAGPATEQYLAAVRENGLYYVWQWARQSGALFAAPLVVLGLGVARPRTPRFVFGTAALALTALYLVYTARVGGDFMGLHRFVMPLFVVVALGTAFGARLLAQRLPAGRPRLVGALLLVAAILGAHGVSQARLTARSMPRWRACAPDDAACIARLGRPFWSSDRGIDTPSYLAVYAHDRARIGEHMKDCLREDDFAIFGGVGAKPYYARARGVDVFGLVSEEIAHEVPRSRPRAGHTKWAPDAKLLEWYQPELVFHCYSLHTDPSRPRLNCSPGFWKRNGYEQVTLHVPGLVERGEYYTFFVRGDRADDLRASCEGVVP